MGGYLPIDYVQLQRSVSCSDSSCNSFQSQAAENWNERRPNEVLALGMISEIYLLERVLRVGVAMVTSEIYLLERVLRVGVAMVTSELR